jgi:glycyl-tRNA synthetase beta chain
VADLLLELQSEEIPARMQARAAEDLRRALADALAAAGLAHDAIVAHATPRRLAASVSGLPLRQPDVTEERRGPRADAPDKAVEGFLRSVGLAREQLETRETDKGPVLFAVVHRAGRPAAEVLADLVPAAIRAVPWPKSMRWGSGALRWVRPLHRIVCLFDGAVVSFPFDGVPVGDSTVGHRFLAPGAFAVRDFADYAARLREAFVVLDAAERRGAILDAVGSAAAAEGLRLRPDPQLADEVAGLVEWPVVLLGRIDDAFMSLPPEVMTTTMRVNQKYFALEHPDGRLAARFAVVANMQAEDGGAAIVAGNERVLRARLSDARFFWDQDRRRPLASRAPELRNIVFHARLGTLDEKVDRVQALAVEIAHHVPGADIDRVRSAARLAKADLVTGMVGEFPELQGTMGRYYARADGEHDDVAEAIADHYAPQGPADGCPSAPVSVAVALADKIDTLVGFFAIDEKPTGSKDPYALRRAALGVIRLIVENGLRIPLRAMFAAAYRLYATDRLAGSAGDADLADFFADRLKVHLREKGVRHDLVAAVFALTGEDDLVRLLARVAALSGFLGGEDGGNLLVAYRRAANIVRIEEKNDGATYRGTADASLLRAPEEQALFAALGTAAADVAAYLSDERYVEAMAALAPLRGPVDAFFDRVTVNCDEPALRRNRLYLLAQIGVALETVADFSRIEG